MKHIEWFIETCFTVAQIALIAIIAHHQREYHNMNVVLRQSAPDIRSTKDDARQLAGRGIHFSPSCSALKHCSQPPTTAGARACSFELKHPPPSSLLMLSQPTTSSPAHLSSPNFPSSASTPPHSPAAPPNSPPHTKTQSPDTSHPKGYTPRSCPAR